MVKGSPYYVLDIADISSYSKQLCDKLAEASFQTT